MKKFGLYLLCLIITGMSSLISAQENSIITDSLIDQYEMEMISGERNLPIHSFIKDTNKHSNSSSKDYGSPPDFDNIITFGGTGEDYITDIVRDATGYYLVGYFSGTIIFDDITLNSAGFNDGLIMRYNNADEYQWHTTIGGNSSDVKIKSAIIDESGFLIIGGDFTSNVGINIGTEQFVSQGIKDVFIAKADLAGDISWAASFYVTGSLAENTDIDADDSNEFYLSSTFGVIKFSQEGVLLQHLIENIAVVDLNIVSTDIYLITEQLVVKYDLSGSEIWTSFPDCDPNKVRFRSITNDNSNDILVSFGYSSSLEFNWGTVNFNYLNPYSGIVVKLDNADGSAIWGDAVIGDQANLFKFKPMVSTYGSDSIMFVTYVNGNITHGGHYYTEGTYAFTYHNSGAEGNAYLLESIDYYDKMRNNSDYSFEFTGPCFHKIYNNNGIVTNSKQSTFDDNGIAHVWYYMDRDNNNNLYIHGKFEGDGYFLGNTLTNMRGPITAKINSDYELEWYVNFTNSDLSARGAAIASDNEGNVYVSGTYSDSLTIDGQTYYNDQAYYLVKINTTGDIDWVEIMDCGSVMAVIGLDVDTENNVIFSTQFSQDITVDGQTYVYAGGRDIIIAKFNGSNGENIWTKQFGAEGSDWARSLAVNSNNDIIVTGCAHNTVDFDGNIIVGGNSSTYSIILSLDKDGNLNWIDNFDHIEGSSRGHAVTVDEYNNVYSHGYYTNDYSIGGQSGSTDGYIYANYLMKHDVSGNLLWFNKTLSSFIWPAYKIDTNENGSIYTVGNSLSDSVLFEGIPILYFGKTNGNYLAKYDYNGNIEWVKLIEFPRFNFTGIFSVLAWQNDNVVVCGRISENIINWDGIEFGVSEENGLIAIIGDLILNTKQTGQRLNLTVFPNPAKDNILLEMPTSVSGSSTISFIDISGKMVLLKEIKGSDIAEINISKLASGTYIIQLRNGNDYFFEKLIIE